MTPRILTLLSFVFFTALVAICTWFKTRCENVSTKDGFFLAGRSLTYPFIAGSMLLTNLSTEQLIGLNGSSFKNGLCVMAWEVVAVITIILMALYFLPIYLKHGITTLPEFLRIRIGSKIATSVNIMFLIAYVFMLLPIILYTGATGLSGIVDIAGLTGIESPTVNLALMVGIVGLIGMAYAMFGGLRTVAVSDTFNGVLLLLGGFILTYFALDFASDGNGFIAGLNIIYTAIPERFNSIGGADSEVPFDQLFTGILLINLFYWCTNQQIIQRTFAAKNLAEGQKGVLLCGLLKLLGPLYLVLPGIIAYYIFTIKLGQDIRSDDAYGMLVHKVLPAPLTGFMLAAILGAIISSFDSVLNSSSTLFSVNLYKEKINKQASEEQVIKVGKYFGCFFGVCAMVVAPFLANTGSIFNFLQNANASFFIPILALILSACLYKRVSDKASVVIFFGGTVVSLLANYVPYFRSLLEGKFYHFSFVMMFIMLFLLKVMGKYCKDAKEIQLVSASESVVDTTSWKYIYLVSCILVCMVCGIYIYFAKF